MISRRLPCALGNLSLGLALAFGVVPWGGAAQQGETTGPPTTVLQTGTRLVVEDVLVMDGKGEPVHGLPKSAFHVFDQGKLQTIKNFEEGSPERSSAEAPPALPPGAFSNRSFLYSSSLISDVFLIDADAIPAGSQMFLLQQLKKSIAVLPPGVQASVFCETSGHMVQMRGLTAQHEDLRRGVAECVPRLPTMLEDSFFSGVKQLLTVAAFLQPLPGRKNILWFSGPFPLVPITDEEQVKGGISADYVAQTEAIHQMQNLLAEARIAVFPLDPRGVSLQAMPTVIVGGAAQENTSPSSTLSRTPTVAPPAGAGAMEEYDQMRQMAEATGGTTSHLNNLEQQINRAVSLGQDAYSVSYSPAGYTADNAWHAIRVTVDGPYRLSYRRGYLANWAGSAVESSRRVLADNADTAPVSGTAAAQSDKPLLFTVQVDAAADAAADSAADPAALREATATRKGAPAHHDAEVSVSVRIPVQQLGFRHEKGTWQSSATVAAYAYDDFGKLKGGKQQELDSKLSEPQWQAAQASQIGTHQAFAMPRSAKYVLFVVTDKTSGRRGTLMIPARVLRPNS